MTKTIFTILIVALAPPSNNPLEKHYENHYDNHYENMEKTHYENATLC